MCGSLSGVSVGEGCLDPFKAYGITSTDCRGSCMKSKIETDNKQGKRIDFSIREVVTLF